MVGRMRPKRNSEYNLILWPQTHQVYLTGISTGPSSLSMPISISKTYKNPHRNAILSYTWAMPTWSSTRLTSSMYDAMPRRKMYVASAWSLLVLTWSQISSCSGFHTLVHAESKNNKGLRAMGVGMCVCARHECVLPTAVGDLQVGER